MGRRLLYNTDNDAKIRKMYVEDGMSLSIIGQSVGCHPETIKRRLLGMGIKIRGISSAMEKYWKNKKKT